MKTLTTTSARKQLGRIVDLVRSTGQSIAIGRRNKPEVFIVRAPHYHPELSDELNFAANSRTFEFLHDEPDIYSDKEVKWKYATKKRV